VLLAPKTIVPHAGGRVTISPGPNGFCQLRYDLSSANNPAGFYQLAASHRGAPLAVIPAAGLGAPIAPYPQPSIMTFVVSDTQGMWGRICPVCRSPFRTNHVKGMIVCPYCTFAEDSIYFLTEQQRRYIKGFAETIMRAVKENRELTIDFDSVTDAPDWTHNERQLQRRFTCTTCQVQTDILGEYGSCPKCGKRNSGSVFHPKLNGIEAQIQTADPDQYPDLLKNLVTIFETMANDLKRILVSVPCHPTRRKQVSQLNFQDITVATERLAQWNGIDLSYGWKAGDGEFVNLMFKRRNLFTHEEGRVDQKYLDETGDRTFELHEVIILKREDMDRLVPLVRRIATNLISGVEAIEVYR
jgi:DNA-directed RNA polymerase subunit RPC12/RpoP